MVNILVVDDFLADRRSIRSVLTGFSDLNVHTIREAENGFQALEQIEKDAPDIVISDIEMPVCDGFELARAIRIRYPRIKIIFCSLYDEFDYARRALYFGGYGYILKPINPEELKQCILRATGHLTDEALRQRDRQEYETLRKVLDEYRPVLVEDLLRTLIMNGLQTSEASLWERIAYLRIGLAKGAFAVAYVEIDDLEKLASAETFEQRQIFRLKLYRRMEEVLRGEGNLTILPLDDAHFAILINQTEAGDVSSSGVHKKVYHCCTKLLAEFAKSDVSLTISVSEPCASLQGVHNLYEQCLYLMKHKYLLGKNKIILPEDVPSTRTTPDFDFNAIQKEVRFLLNSGTAVDIEQFIDQLFRAAPPYANAVYFKNLCFSIVICMQIALTENHEALSDTSNTQTPVWETLLRFETVADASRWIKTILIDNQSLLAVRSQHHNSQMVEKIKKYIESNYTRNFNLDVLAADLFYSPNYLNRIFKQETGETIFEYATTFRMEKAKELLHDPNIKLQGVSEALGYSNPAYFSSVFKKSTGMTLKEYRERYLA